MSKEKLLPDNPTEAVFVAHCLKIGLSTAGEMRGYRRGVMDERSDRRTPAKDEGEKAKIANEILGVGHNDAKSAAKQARDGEELAAMEGRYLKVRAERDVSSKRITDLQAALADAHTDSRQQKDRVERLVEGSKEKDKRIEELEKQRSVSLNQINTLQAKLKSAEAVVDAGRELNMRMDVVHADEEYKSVWLLAHTHGGYQGPNYKDEKERFDAALSAHDKGEQEPEEQHFIEEGLAE